LKNLVTSLDKCLDNTSSIITQNETVVVPSKSNDKEFNIYPTINTEPIVETNNNTTSSFACGLNIDQINESLNSKQENIIDAKVFDEFSDQESDDEEEPQEFSYENSKPYVNGYNR
jgi:hypothetical protein